MRERQYSKDEILKGVVSLLDKAVILEKDPCAFTNIGGAARRGSVDA